MIYQYVVDEINIKFLPDLRVLHCHTATNRMTQESDASGRYDKRENQLGTYLTKIRDNVENRLFDSYRLAYK